jgi:hypothetical protein
VETTTPHLKNQAGGIVGMADIFDRYILDLPAEMQYRQTELPVETQREMMAFLLRSPWLAGIQDTIQQNDQKFIPKEELLGQLLDNPDYDYGGAYLARGESMFGVDPASGTHHGFSRTPEGRFLKAPDHSTSWKEIFYNEMGFSPDTAKESPHPSMTRTEAARVLMQR